MYTCLSVSPEGWRRKGTPLCILDSDRGIISVTHAPRSARIALGPPKELLRAPFLEVLGVFP